MITGMKRRIPLFLVSAIGVTFLGVSLAMAEPAIQWAVDGAPVVTAAKDQQSHSITTDGHGGMISAWQDFRRLDPSICPTNYLLCSVDIYAQRLNSDGQPQWGANGVPVSTVNRWKALPSILNDGQGGAFIVWQDWRSGNYDIYAQHLNADGHPLWASDGIPIAVAVRDQSAPTLVSDGRGGAIIAWVDQRRYVAYYIETDIFAQRVTSDGRILWVLNGVPVSQASGAQTSPRLVEDGHGGAFVAYQDDRSLYYYTVTKQDIFVQHLNDAGQLLWNSDGVPVCNAPGSQIFHSGNNNQAVVMVSDNAGGIILAWWDQRAGEPQGLNQADIYAQRISASGQPLWISNGAPVSRAINWQRDPQLTTDGEGGVIIVWEDLRNGSLVLGDFTPDIYAQRLTAEGRPLWNPDGLIITPQPHSQATPSIVTDGHGGLIMASISYAPVYYGKLVDINVDAQRLDGEGRVLWTMQGIPISHAPYSQLNPLLLGDGDGGAIVAWLDRRTGLLPTGHYDLYAQRIADAPVNRAPQFASAPLMSIKEGGRVKIALIARDPDEDPLALSAANLPGFVIFTDLGNGQGELALAPGYDDAGLYTIELTADDGHGGTANLVVQITVVNVNRSPEFGPVVPQSLSEGTHMNVMIVTHDPDHDLLVLSAGSLPGFATFTDQGNGTGVLSLSPGYDAAGLYTVQFTANDGHATASLAVQITVLNVNRPPSFVGLTAQQIAECATLTLLVTAVDPDGDPITAISASQLPAGATFVNHTLHWTPTAHQAGSYTIQLTASDGQLGTEYSLHITVAQTPYGFGGFLPPLSATSPNIARLGSTVPIKFRISVCGPDTTAHATVWVQPFVNGQPAGLRQPARSTDKATVGNAITNTDGTKLFHYNLKTLGLTKGVWQIQVDLDDGTTHTVMLTLR